MARIAIGGFQHETNTFAPHRADLAAFENVAAFPRLPRGAALIEEMRPLNIPIGGFIQAAEAAGHQLLPSVWAMAVPSAQVSDEAFDHITDMLCTDIAAAAPLDAVYLCLHGAMVSDSFEDGEGEVLRRVRAVVGPEIPIVVSLDLHCNTTAEMVELSDAMVAYRTYPHVDMALTGRRAYQLLGDILTTGKRPAKAFRKTDFLISLVWQCSLIEPARGIYASFEALQTGDVLSVSFTPGFPPADIQACGPAVFAYGRTQAAADGAVAAVFGAVDAARASWDGELLAPDEAVGRAMRGYVDKPFVIADTQDNPGAGGASDTVGMLESLVRLKAQDAVFASLYDPPTAAAAHAAGVGASLTRGIGAGSGQPGHVPFQGTFTVEALSDGDFVGTGPMAGGRHFRLGPCAVLRIGGVRVLVSSGRAQTLDQAILRHIGIDPLACRILVVKSSVHFRNDFQDLAEQVLVAVAPGPNLADHTQVPYRNLRPGLSLTP